VRTNYVLVDFENVQPQQLILLKNVPAKIKVFLGPTQTKIPVEIALCLQSFGCDAEYVRVDASGPNALDFHIAFYIGELVAADATGYFHIISKDTGFDPLIRHLQARKISISRHPEVAAISPVKIASVKTLEDKIATILERLEKLKARPASLKTLQSSLYSLFLKQLPEQEITLLIEELVKRKIIAFNGEKVVYHLP
jgi:hypothetical protein